jgi:hypothetical protein
VAPRTDLPAAPPADRDDRSIPQVATELWELATEYAKQETIEPLKGLGRFIAFGVAGSLALGVGVILLLLGGLRALQTETSTTFTGSWSWAPYLIAVAAGLVLVALALWRITKRKGPGA